MKTTEEKQKVYEDAEESYKNCENMFITGAGGCGKTYFINQMLENYPKRNVKICAYTGVASNNFQFGSTIHSLLGITPKVSKVEHVKFISPKVRETLKSLTTVIIDESPMVPIDLLQIFDKIAKISRGNRQPFGGLHMVFVGDYYQLPPIQDDNKPQVYFFDTLLYKSLSIRPFLFEINHRQSDQEFIDILSDIRIGKYSERVREFEDLVKSKPVDVTMDSTIITTTNKAKDMYNADFMNQINEQVYSFNSIDYALNERFKYKLDNCKFLKTLQLKKGCKVMLLKNYKDLGLINGSMGVVEDIGTDFIRVQFKNVTTTIQKEKFEVWDTHNNDLLLAKRTQYPLVPGYAVTVHKIQGVTLDSAILDIDFAFTYGIIYVALSRVRTIEGVFIRSMDLTLLTPNASIDHWYAMTFA
jgi:ATP-dependent exoDNAse (exonuclease V) alpha subunit